MKFRQSAEKAKAEIRPPQQQPKQKTNPKQAAAKQTNPRELWLELEANNLSSWRTGGSRFNHMNRKKLQATRSVAALRGHILGLCLPIWCCFVLSLRVNPNYASCVAYKPKPRTTHCIRQGHGLAVQLSAARTYTQCTQTQTLQTLQHAANCLQTWALCASCFAILVSSAREHVVTRKVMTLTIEACLKERSCHVQLLLSGTPRTTATMESVPNRRPRAVVRTSARTTTS